MSFDQSNITHFEVPDLPLPLKKFVTEKEIADERETAPSIYGGAQRKETTPDGRTLYERLQENKMKQEEEFAERIKFRTPRPLDDDDISFLESKQRQDMERRLRNEEEVQRELVEFRVSLMQVILKAEEITTPTPLVATVTPPPTSKSQKPSVQVKVVTKVAPKGSVNTSNTTTNNDSTNNKRKLGEETVNSNNTTHTNDAPTTKKEGEQSPAEKKTKGNPLSGLLGFGDGESGSDSE